VELLFELPSTGLDKVKVAVQVNVHMAAEEFRGDLFMLFLKLFKRWIKVGTYIQEFSIPAHSSIADGNV